MATDRLLQYISDGYLQVGADWRVRAANARVEGLLLRHGQPVVGCTLWEVMPDILGSPAEREIRAVAAGTVPRRVEHFSPTKYIWVEAFVVPGADGCELFVQNVSNRAKVMETDAVRAAVRRILMHAPVAISITRGPEHRYEMLNARAQEIVGRRDVEGQLARTAFPELAGSGLFEVLDEVYRTGVPYVGRAVPVRYDREGDGTLVDAVFDFTYQPLLEPDGRVWGIMSVAVEAGGAAGS
jgi:PAS domain-containing protein